MASLTKQLKDLEQAIIETKAMADLPEEFRLNTCFNLENPEDRERCERLEKWIADHPEYNDNMYILKICKIDGSETALTQEK